MDNENENSDSLNGENEDADSQNGENQEEKINLDVLQKEKTELSEKNKQLFERAKKSETETKELREQIKKLSNSSKGESSKDESNEPDYGRLAFLQAKGIDNPDDIKIVQDEASRLKLPLTDVLGMEHIQSKLRTNKEEREAKAGMPKGSGRSGGSSQHDVDYWLAKGETPDDQELAEKVVDARITKEKNQKFADDLPLYT